MDAISAWAVLNAPTYQDSRSTTRRGSFVLIDFEPKKQRTPSSLLVWLSRD